MVIVFLLVFFMEWGEDLVGCEVVKGCVVYFVGENFDDIVM